MMFISELKKSHKRSVEKKSLQPSLQPGKNAKKNVFFKAAPDQLHHQFTLLLAASWAAAAVELAILYEASPDLIHHQFKLQNLVKFLSICI